MEDDLSDSAEYSDSDDNSELKETPGTIKAAEEKLELLEENSDEIRGQPAGFFSFEEEDHECFWRKGKRGNEKQVTVNDETTSKANGPSKPQSPKLQTKLDGGKIVREVMGGCCKKKCIQDIPIREIKDAREHYWTKNVQERKAMLTGAVKNGLVFKGGFVCSKAWCTIYGIAQTSYFQCLQAVRENRNQAETKRKPKRKSLAYDLAIEWFRNFSKNADHMPNSSSRPLPACLSKKAVYIMYKKEMGEKPVLGRSQFIYKMWKKNFPQVYIPKQSRFTKCAICVHLREQLRTPGLTEEQRKELELMRKIHLTQQMAEREKYYKHGLKAEKEPSKYISITIDGMDQNKHNLPHFNTSTKIDGSAWRLKTHISGVLVNHRNMAYAFVDLCEWSHDSNLTINVLLATLADLKESLGYLPKILYLQMDNCWRENNNKFVIAFLSILVEIGIFDKIKLSFLVVGHTHEDIDQMFSCYARRLSKHDAKTLPELMEEIQASFSPSVKVKLLQSLFDVKGWMSGHVGDLTGHTPQHQFKIVRNKDGKAEMFYRKWSSTKNWSPEGKGITVHTGVPSGDPSLSSPVIANLNLERIKQDLPKFRLQFTNAEQKWWEDFIREQSDRDGKRRGKGPRVKWILPTLREDEIDERPNDEAVERYAALQQLLSKEQKEVKVSVRGKKRKEKGTAKKSSQKKARK